MLSYQKLKQRYRYSAILLRELVRTDFKLRYQGSVLGYLWSLLRPLFLFVIMYVVFVYVLHIGKGVPHWPAALLLGIVLWNFFAEITNHGLRAVVNKSSLIRKINFPRYVIMFATCASALINLVLNLIIVGIFMAINHVDFTWGIALLPLFIIEIMLFAMGLAFILSTLYVRYRDFNFVWEILMQALFYGSAIFFPISTILVHHRGVLLAKLMLMNPVCQAIQDARHYTISSGLDTLRTVGGSGIIQAGPFLIMAAFLLLGMWYFRSRSSYFAEDV